MRVTITQRHFALADVRRRRDGFLKRFGHNQRIAFAAVRAAGFVNDAKRRVETSDLAQPD
jgi:hypothetical protein